jgi:eight-cysteine-cluster-containing protein
MNGDWKIGLLASALLLVGACARNDTAARQAPAATQGAEVPLPIAIIPDVPPPPTAPGEDVGPKTLDSKDLYGMCRERVEGRETPGECVSDADCQKAGCSGEVCVAVPQAAGMMTTCEIRPCYAALDSCGCQEGLCRWTLKEGPIDPLPGGGQPIPLPLPQ